MTSHRYPNDTWSLSDDLGLGGVGDQVARTLLEAQAPFTLGVTGKWGSGKTSVLRRAFATLGGLPLEQARRLDEPAREQGADDDWKALSAKQRLLALGWDDSYHTRIEQSLCVWFSPWQHQGEDNPLIPLVREIQAQFESRLGIMRKLEVDVNKRKRSAGLAALSLIEHVADAAISLKAGRAVKMARGMSDAVRKGWREGEDNTAALSDGQRFHLLFEDAVDELLRALARDDAAVNQYTRLVIFVDDLDRCEESVIVQLLEAIKLYLGSRRCVFVLGLDHGAVMDALDHHWESRSEDANREYLEKLFQATVAVPLPRPDEVKITIEQQLAIHHIPGQGDDVDHLRADMATDIERLLEPNPRKLKNFINSLCAGWALHGAGAWAGWTDGVEARRFVLFQYLRLYHPRLWRLLERQPVTLVLLWHVLSKSEPGIEGLELESLDKDAQRLLEQFFSHAFCHVLADDSDSGSFDVKLHRTQDIDKALEAFEHRQDRKRSDETFVAAFRTLYPSEPGRLPDGYLYAVESGGKP